jgi:LAO/AO transport system kinase
MGDDIQAIKAGLLEIADIHVVNKSDRPDANRTVAELRNMLSLVGPPAAGGWDIPILQTVAAKGEGVDDLVDTFDRHLRWLRDTGELEARERRSATARVTAVAQDLLLEELVSPSHGDAFERAVDDVQHRRTDPRTAGRRLIRVAAGASEPEGAAR